MARRLGSANREAERRILDALQIRLAARAERALGAELARQYRAAADAVERQEPLPAIPREGTGRIILAAWETAATAFGNRMFDALGKRGRLRMERKDLSEAFRAAFLAFAEEWLAVKITQISDTTADQIRQLVVEGEQEGASVEAIAKRIRSEAAPMSRLRAHVIARTETHFAAGWANEQAASEADIPLVKEWAATADSRTRESHLEADGQTVPMGQAFEVGGYALRYPGDAAGPAEEVINCFPAGTMVNPAAQAAMRRWYDGPMIRLCLEGLEVAATPNHPVLTLRGWIPIVEVGEGDRVLGIDQSRRLVRLAPDGQHGDMDIAQIFELLREVAAPERIPCRAANFHGETPDHEVDVVALDRVFGAVTRPEAIEERSEVALEPALLASGPRVADRPARELVGRLAAPADGVMGGLGQGGPLSRGGLAHSQAHRFGAVALADSGEPQPAHDGASRHAQLFRNSLDARARLEKSHSLAAQLLAANLLGGRSSPADVGRYSGLAALEHLRDLGDILGFPVKPYCVLRRETFDFSGHVFNLETGIGAYAANGIVAHNCRCQALYLEP